jgi:hypothetical protein
MRSRQLVLLLLGPAVVAACRDNPTGIRGPLDLLEFNASVSKSVVHLADTATLRFALRNSTRDTVMIALSACAIRPYIRDGSRAVYAPSTQNCYELAIFAPRPLAPGAEIVEELVINGRTPTLVALPGIGLPLGRYTAYADLYQGVRRSSLVQFEVVQ